MCKSCDADDAAAEPVYWLSPVPPHCQMPGCSNPFGEVMFDASLRVPGAGRSYWGNYCIGCFTECSGGLGTGRGQKYELQADGRWLKVEG